jgi:hypothetical protein
MTTEGCDHRNTEPVWELRDSRVGFDEVDAVWEDTGQLRCVDCGELIIDYGDEKG